MHRSGSRSRPVSVLVLLAFSSATLATTSAHADLSFPMADTFVGSGPAAPAAAAPSPITPLVSPAAPSQPIELREVFWGDRYGQVRHGPFPFQGNRPLDGSALYRALGRDDLSRAYESRVDAKIALAITALGALVTGGIVLKARRPRPSAKPHRRDTPSKHRSHRSAKPTGRRERSRSGLASCCRALPYSSSPGWGSAPIPFRPQSG